MAPQLFPGTVAQLERILRRSGGDPAAHLRISSPARLARIRARAKRCAVWSRLDALDPTAPIPVLRRSAYRGYQRDGRREGWQTVQLQRLARLDDASLALWLGHPQADLDHLQDLMWAATEDWTWVMPAHEPVAVDLGSAAWANLLAEAVDLHRDRLEPEVVARVLRCIDERVWTPVADATTPLWWREVRTNWSTVCWGGVAMSAMLLVDDPRRLARLLHPALRGLEHGLAGFTADGGCQEGIDYWDYGFGSYLRVAFALHQRSDGAIDLMAPGLCRNILHFPQACYLRGPVRAVFGDGRPGHLLATTALMASRLGGADGLLAYCRPDAGGRLHCRSVHELALADERRLPAPAAERDVVLPVLGQARIQGAPGPGQLTLFAHAGDNGIPHNHNDLGSYVLYRGDRELLTDPGGPRYTSATFGPRRYDNLYCGAQGHSVPVIDHVQQEAGAGYSATLSASIGDGVKRVAIDLGRAYPRRAGIRSYIRTFHLDARANRLELVEELSLRRTPGSLLFRFISHADARLQARGARVLVGGAQGLVLSASVPGRFSIELLRREAQAEGKKAVIRRITFSPRDLARSGSYRFTMAP